MKLEGHLCMYMPSVYINICPQVLFKYQFCVHNGVLVREGDVVTVKGGLMQEPKARALSP